MSRSSMSRKGVSDMPATWKRTAAVGKAKAADKPSAEPKAAAVKKGKKKKK